jgi:excisionase family DNA binding protein
MAQTTGQVFLSVPQMGRRLGVSTRTAYALVADGEVPVIRLRGVLRVPVSALDRWLADREQEALNAVRSGSG